MAKQNETGHAINVDNFYELIQFVITYGVTYSPTMDALKLPQLNEKYTEAGEALQLVTNRATAYNNTVNDRVETFAPSRKLATRVINLLEVSGASPEVIKDAKSINRKIQGKRAANPQPVPPGSPPPITISASQQSFAQTIEHWAALISLLQSEPLYLPNETDLQITNLTTMHNAMITDDQLVAESWAQVTNGRNQRDEVLYSPATGLVATAALVKKYVKALYGTESLQFKELNHINFKTFKRA